MKARGLGGSPRAGVTRAMVFRAIMSALAVLVVGILAFLAIFKLDVLSIAEQRQHVANAALMQEVNGLAQARMEGLSLEIKTVDEDIKALDLSFAVDLERQNQNEIDLKRQRARLDRVRADERAAREEAANHRRLEGAERGGIEMEGASGLRGCYDKCIFHREQAELAELRMAALSAEAAALTTEIAALRQVTSREDADLGDRRAAAREVYQAAP